MMASWSFSSCCQLPFTNLILMSNEWVPRNEIVKESTVTPPLEEGGVGDPCRCSSLFDCGLLPSLRRVERIEGNSQWLSACRADICNLVISCLDKRAGRTVLVVRAQVSTLLPLDKLVGFGSSSEVGYCSSLSQ